MLQRAFILLLLTGSVATCGQKGPLEPPALAAGVTSDAALMARTTAPSAA